MATYDIYGNQVQLQLPDAWDDRSIYTFVAPEQTLSAGLPTMSKTQGFRPNVVVTREARNKVERIDTYAKEQLLASQKQLPRLKVIEETPLSVSGQPAITRVFTFTTPEPQNVVVQQMQTFVLASSWIYTFTFSTLPATFSEQRKMFDQIIGQTKIQ